MRVVARAAPMKKSPSIMSLRSGGLQKRKAHFFFFLNKTGSDSTQCKKKKIITNGISNVQTLIFIPINIHNVAKLYP